MLRQARREEQFARRGADQGANGNVQPQSNFHEGQDGANDLEGAAVELFAKLGGGSAKHTEGKGESPPAEVEC